MKIEVGQNGREQPLISELSIAAQQTGLDVGDNANANVMTSIPYATHSDIKKENPFLEEKIKKTSSLRWRFAFAVRWPNSNETALLRKDQWPHRNSASRSQYETASIDE